MRICLISPYELSLEGGVNKHVFYLAQAFARMGDEVEVLGAGQRRRRPREPGVTAFGGVVSIQGNESDNRIGIFTSPWEMRRYMKAHFDVVHVHEPFVPTIPYYSLWPATRPPACAPSTATTRTRRSSPARPAGDVPVPRRFQRGIAVSSAAARYAQVAWPRPLSIIPNGVDTSFFTPVTRAPERRAGDSAVCWSSSASGPTSARACRCCSTPSRGSSSARST